MAMAMALRRLSSSVDKPLQRLVNGGSVYYMASLPNEAVYEKEKSRVSLFLPVLQSEHWFCMCISLVESRVYILDSMKHTAENLEQVDILQKNLFALLKKTRTRSRNDSRRFKVEYADVPQQMNIHDCGIYVMKFVDRWDGQTYLSAELQRGHIPNIRKRLLLHLFMDENYKERDSILKVIPCR